jgi:hypothetical protein
VAGHSEYDDELSGSIKGVEFFGRLNNCQPVKKKLLNLFNRNLKLRFESSELIPRINRTKAT